MLRHLLDDPGTCLVKADVVVQWGVARKRAAYAPSTLLSTIWAPWWEIAIRQPIPATDFRPIPRVDAGYLADARRDPCRYQRHALMRISSANNGISTVESFARVCIASHKSADRLRSIANYSTTANAPIAHLADRSVRMPVILKLVATLIREWVRLTRWDDEIAELHDKPW